MSIIFTIGNTLKVESIATSITEPTSPASVQGVLVDITLYEKGYCLRPGHYCVVPFDAYSEDFDNSSYIADTASFIADSNLELSGIRVEYICVNSGNTFIKLTNTNSLHSVRLTAGLTLGRALPVR